jgi:hypothetical protein
MFDLKQKQHPLHLTPVAEADMIADIAAAIGAQSRFDAGMLAKSLDQGSGIVIATTINQYGEMHSDSNPSTPGCCSFWSDGLQPRTVPVCRWFAQLRASLVKGILANPPAAHFVRNWHAWGSLRVRLASARGTWHGRLHD